MNETWQYLQNPAVWFAPGPLIAHAVCVLFVLGLWITTSQVAPNSVSNKFYHRSNSAWTGVLMMLVGFGVYVFFNAPFLLEIYNKLLSDPLYLFFAVVAVVLVVGGFLLNLWARNQPKS